MCVCGHTMAKIRMLHLAINPVLSWRAGSRYWTRREKQIPNDAASDVQTNLGIIHRPNESGKSPCTLRVSLPDSRTNGSQKPSHGGTLRAETPSVTSDSERQRLGRHSRGAKTCIQNEPHPFHKRRLCRTRRDGKRLKPPLLHVDCVDALCRRRYMAAGWSANTFGVSRSV